MNIKIFYIALLLILCSVIAISSVVQSKEWQGEQDRAKLIRFSHQYHLKQIGAECKECHRNAEASQSSADMLLPAMAVCYDCHDHQATKCDYCHATSDTTKYVAFEKTERETIFSHKYHLTEAKLKCADCHEGLDAVDYAAQGLKAMPAMQKCATCHRLETSVQSEPARDTTKMAMATTTAATACEACHTDLVTLLPRSHRVNNFIQEHKNPARLGTVENKCATCHGENFCQECHDAANLVQNVKLPANFHTPSAPKTSGNDNTKELIVQKVHGLNYRFTHAIDAKGKESDCLTCHDQRTFCAECHSPNGIESNKLTPVWHGGSSFVTIGRGSGGGRHAQYARRDIESCATCHDTNGNDPSCTICHVDPDGIKGNDPKTHESGFDKDVHGSWHTDRGAICYNCHTDANARPDGRRGIGFCGYCHGGR